MRAPPEVVGEERGFLIRSALSGAGCWDSPCAVGRGRALRVGSALPALRQRLRRYTHNLGRLARIAPGERGTDYGLLCRHGGNGLQDPTGNLVGVTLRVGPAILQVAPVAVVGEAMRHADGGTPVGDAIVEFVDGLRLLQPGEAQMIVWAVDRDVLVLLFIERGHERLEVGLATDFAHVFGREI